MGRLRFQGRNEADETKSRNRRDRTVSIRAIALSFGCAFAIGAFFGWVPARRAAALNPIEALRYE